MNADNCGDLPGRWKSADAHLLLSGLNEQQRRLRYDGGETRWSLYKAEETKEQVASSERLLAAQKQPTFSRAEWDRKNRDNRNERLRTRMAAETEEEKAARRKKVNERRAKRWRKKKEGKLRGGEGRVERRRNKRERGAPEEVGMQHSPRQVRTPQVWMDAWRRHPYRLLG